MAMLFSVATAVTLVSCGGNSDNNSYNQYQEPQETETNVKTYSFTDGGGYSYTLTVDGEKVVLSGNGNTYYGSFSFAGSESIRFSEVLYLTDNNILTSNPTGKPFHLPTLKNGYLYFSNTAAKAEDPTKRFELR